MLTLSLEPTDDHASPAFNNVASCKKWLRQLPLLDLAATQTTLRAQLDEFNRFPMRGMERLQTLELLRETVHEVQEECAGKLAGKPLPLNEPELVLLASITGLWQSLANGYQRCLMAYQEGEKKLATYGALLCHRCLMYAGRQIFEFLRTGYEFDGEQWRQFHAVYLYAEEEGLLAAEVEDEFSEHGHVTSCRFIYLKSLFACLARPQELPFSQQQLLQHWLSLWIDTFTITSTCTVSRGDAPPLAIDPASTSGLQPVRPEFFQNPKMRYVAMVPMSKLLRVKTILLQQGKTPGQLDLGAEHDRLECIELLTHLHRQWCEPRRPRKAERGGTEAEMQLRYGLEDINSWIANQPFNFLKNPADIFQETWTTEDLSLLGARLLRPSASRARLGINQIVAVRAGDVYHMAVTVWVSVMRTGQLHMGIRFLPGAPTPATVKVTVNPGEPRPIPAPGILLSAVSKLNLPPSLLMPRNVFQPDRLAEIALPNNEKLRVRLKFTVEKGTDFERVSFLPD